jgi:hypothetical protein
VQKPNERNGHLSHDAVCVDGKVKSVFRARIGPHHADSDEVLYASLTDEKKEKC